MILMAVRPGMESPEQLIPLPEPSFDYDDIRNWVTKIVDYFEWPVDIGDYWIETIEQECIIENGIYEIDEVYIHLKAIQEIFQSHERLTHEHFMEHLKQRR